MSTGAAIATNPYVSGQHFSGFSTFSFEQLIRGAERFLCGGLTLGRWTSSDGVGPTGPARRLWRHGSVSVTAVRGVRPDAEPLSITHKSRVLHRDRDAEIHSRGCRTVVLGRPEPPESPECGARRDSAARPPPRPSACIIHQVWLSFRGRPRFMRASEGSMHFHFAYRPQ